MSFDRITRNASCSRMLQPRVHFVIFPHLVGVDLVFFFCVRRLVHVYIFRVQWHPQRFTTRAPQRKIPKIRTRRHVAKFGAMCPLARPTRGNVNTRPQSHTTKRRGETSARSKTVALCGALWLRSLHLCRRPTGVLCALWLKICACGHAARNELGCWRRGCTACCFDLGDAVCCVLRFYERHSAITLKSPNRKTNKTLAPMQSSNAIIHFPMRLFRALIPHRARFVRHKVQSHSRRKVKISVRCKIGELRVRFRVGHFVCCVHHKRTDQVR